MARYDVQPTLGYDPDDSIVPTLVKPPVMFIAPPDRSVASGELWFAICSDDPNYGGCIVHLSNDGTTYYPLGALYGKSIQGKLTAALPATSGVDTTNTLKVDFTISGRIIESVDQQTVDNLDSLCYVGGEFLAYRDATLTAVNQYNLTYLKRGLYGSTAGAANGADFALLHGPLYKWRFNPNSVGKTLHFKFQGFNLVQGGLQDMATLADYTYVLPNDGGQKALQSDLSNYQPLNPNLTDIAGLTPTNNFMLVGDGTQFTMTPAPTGSGALVNFTETANTTAPNTTTPVVTLAAANGAVNVDVAVKPKGTGSFALGVADNAVAGGNKRGANAVDLQTVRTDPLNVAAGVNSVLGGGKDNRATGANTTVGGGELNTMAARNSTAPGGSGALSWINGALHYAGDGSVLAQGDSQKFTVLLKANTTNATAKVMTTDHAAATTTNQLNLGAMNDCAVVITGAAAAKQSGGINSAGWVIQIAAVCSATGVITIRQNTITALTGNAAGWTLTAAVNAANKAIAFSFKGAAGADIVATAALDVVFVLRG